MNRSVVLFCISALFSTGAIAQDLSRIEVGTDNNAAALSGGNVFDFSNSRSNPPAPGLPSFAGGPCAGEGAAASTSIAGVALGGGRSTLDESCQRRNWVQTVIGASQHMNEADARIMMQLAVEVMREDPYLAGPLERVGIGSFNVDGVKKSESNRKKIEDIRGTSVSSRAVGEAGSSATTAEISSRSVRFAPSCIVAANTVPSSTIEMFHAKGCDVIISGEGK